MSNQAWGGKRPKAGSYKREHKDPLRNLGVEIDQPHRMIVFGYEPQGCSCGSRWHDAYTIVVFGQRQPEPVDGLHCPELAEVKVAAVPERHNKRCPFYSGKTTM